MSNVELNISPVLEQYLYYLGIIKGRSENTINEYQNDLVSMFRFISKSRKASDISNNTKTCYDIDFIKSISMYEMYSFIAQGQNDKKVSASTRARRIVSIRQFWKYLKTKAHLIDNNITEELETPKIPKRVPRYLSLEDSMRLLLKSEKSIRNHCILTIFLNCALRLSELTSINIKTR